MTRNHRLFYDDDLFVIHVSFWLLPFKMAVTLCHSLLILVFLISSMSLQEVNKTKALFTPSDWSSG